METVNNSTLLPNFFTDETGNVWGLSTPAKGKGVQVVHNGAIDQTTLNVALLLYHNHAVYHQNSAGKWYIYQSSHWVSTSDPIVTAVGTTPPPQSPVGWPQTYFDDFNTLDLSKYSTAFPWGSHFIASNAELEYYCDPTVTGIDVFSTSNSILSITANLATAQQLPAIQGQTYTSGMLTTSGAFSQTYGYFEMRAKLPLGQGLWPAFWLIPQNFQWPPELDIMEMIGNYPTTLNTTVHFLNSSNNATAIGFTPTVADMTAGFHTYGAIWTATYIAWYFDGNLVSQTSTPSDFNLPMYMVINLAVGGNWPGSPTSSTIFPAVFAIDYLKACALPSNP
jgi:beta-glucanase (GH16 family)